MALRVLVPNALRPIEDLVPLLYPGVKVSYGTIQQMLVEAEGRAARFLSIIDWTSVGVADGLPHCSMERVSASVCRISI